jgi:hypothetical protein
MNKHEVKLLRSLTADALTNAASLGTAAQQVEFLKAEVDRIKNERDQRAGELYSKKCRVQFLESTVEKAQKFIGEQWEPTPKKLKILNFILEYGREPDEDDEV